MASAGDTPSGPGTPESPDPIVVHADVHGDIAEWNPSPPPPAPLRFGSAPDEVIPPGVGQSPAPPELAAGEAKRAFGLDALRGLFLVLMTFGFSIGTAHFPLWMFHRQFPFDTATPVDAAGISWRDLAYVSFLLTMAAALPLTLSRRIAKGEPEIGIIIAALKRWALLMVFAILVGHSNTFFLGYTQSARVLSIIGFVIMAMVFTRRRADWSEPGFRAINIAGWVMAIAFLALTPITYGSTFSFARNDDIIVGLAFASLVGALVWYFTRENLIARLAILGLVVAAYLGAKGDGWVAGWWWDAKYPWLFSAQALGLLTIVIPGTIIGDIILKWMRAGTDSAAAAGWGPVRTGGVALLCLAFTPVVTAGMYNRQVALTVAIVGAMLVAGAILTWSPVTSVERMMRSLFIWAATWLAIGLLVEPFEGGIKKIPDTLSYFFTVTGTTAMLLVAFTAVIDGLGRQRWVATLIDVGHNPLLAYVLLTILINPATDLIPPLRGLLLGSPVEELLRCVLEVLLVVFVVRYLSRKRIYWRT